MLKIAKNLSLPLDFVTERVAFLARTGAGKSGGMRVMAEEMLAAGHFIVFLDPKGDAYGIRSDYSVLIMGGEHADVPLQATAGKFVADFLVKERISSVLDVSEFSETDMVRFVADFGEQFYRKNRAAVHVFIDEADEFAPQSGYNANQAKCLGAIQRMQRRGRGRGIGVTVATQRSAVLNKSVLTQAGTLIAMQTTAPHDLKAVDAWLEYAATKEARNAIMAALPTMKAREAFVYSPQFLGSDPKRITFHAFKSFDSMRTPRHGEKRKQPKKLADIDLVAIQKEMAATLEEAKANDPKALKQKVAELEKQLKSGNSVAALSLSPAANKQLLVQAKAEGKATSDNEWRPRLEAAQAANEQLRSQLQQINNLSRVNGKLPTIKIPASSVVAKRMEKPLVEPQQLSSAAVVVAEAEIKLSAGHKKILSALYWLRDESRESHKVAFYAGYTINGHFNNLIGNLRSWGLAANWSITKEGATAIAAEAGEKPEGDELRGVIKAKLSAGEKKMFDTLLEAGGDRLSTKELASRSGYTINGHFNNQLGHLRSICVAEGYEKDGGIKLIDSLLV